MTFHKVECIFSSNNNISLWFFTFFDQHFRIGLSNGNARGNVNFLIVVFYRKFVWRNNTAYRKTYFSHAYNSFNTHSIPGSVLTILKAAQASKAAGIDNLSRRLLKDGAKFLSKPISGLYSLSITSGKFPDPCKVAKLKPLYKKGSVTEPCNYRPISLLPLISKVIEKVIHDQTSTFLNSKNLLYTYQSGFRKKHSTDFCLIWMIKF